MNLDHMKVFLCVLDRGSFAQAAREMYITQPAVSAIVASLEAELGKKLLERTSGQRSPIKPTTAGKTFAAYCKKAIFDYDRMRISLAQENVITTPFILVSSPSANAFISPTLLGLFQSNFPKVPCKYASYSTDIEVSRLRARQCDLAIFSKTIVDEDLVCEKFLNDSMVLICPANMKINSNITCKTLTKLPMIVRNNSPNSFQLINSALLPLGYSMKDLNITLELPSAVEIFYSVARGLGCGFVPISFLMMGNNQTAVKIISVSKMQIDHYLQIAYLRNVPLSPGAQLFRDYIFSSRWEEQGFPLGGMKIITQRKNSYVRAQK